MKDPDKDVIEKSLNKAQETQPEETQATETVEQASSEMPAPQQEEEQDGQQKNESNRAKLLSSLLEEDEEKEPEIRHMKDVLRAMQIDGLWFRKQLGVITLVLLGVILYITNRYQAQQEMIEEERLRSELLDKKFRSMTRNSELTFRLRQSQLEKQLRMLGDSTLLPSSEPLYKLTTDN